MIKIKDVSKKFGDVKVLEKINIKIESGEIYGLVGRSGTGKSTLLRCINNLENISSGSIEINGVKINELEGKDLLSFRKNIGMIFQDFSLLDRKTVFNNIALPMRCWGFDSNDIEKRVIELAELVGLSNKINSEARELSGGQKQRVAIARALTLNPSILLCDEVTSALDPKTANEILNLLLEINKNLGITIVVVAHQMSVIQKICNKMAILENGTVSKKGKVIDIFIKKPLSLLNLTDTETVVNNQLDKYLIDLYCNVDEREIIPTLSDKISKGFYIEYTETKLFREGVIYRYVLEINRDDLTQFQNFFDSKNLYYEIIKPRNEAEVNA